METILKPHNQIELPQEVCRRLELLPGVRLEIEIDGKTGTIILQPVTKRMRKIRFPSRVMQIKKNGKTKSANP